MRRNRDEPEEASTSEDLAAMTPEMLVPTDPQESRETMENIVKKTMLSMLPEVLKHVENSSVKSKISEEIKLVKNSLVMEISEMIASLLVTQMLPILMENIRKVVREEIQTAKDGSLPGVNGTSTDAALCLKFNEAPYNVLTGKEIKAEGGAPVTVAIYNENDQVIETGPESSAKVEILFLEASENDREHSWSHEEFNNRIIEESDKKKPHFAKRYYVYLEKGRGTLSNAKLANGSVWTKSCKCRLGARVVDNLARVREALTEPFVVSDGRSQLYVKRYPPSLSDEVWRLDYIGRDGEPCKRLKKNHVLTVGDLLFLHSVDPLNLKKIIGAGDTAWKVIENHAQSCIIDDTRLGMYTDPSEPSTTAVFDVVGKLKALIHDSQYVQYNSLSDDDKGRAHELLRSAFEHRDRITFHRDETETTLMQQQSRKEASKCNACPNPFINGSVVSLNFNPAVDTSVQAETPRFTGHGYQQPLLQNLSALNESAEVPPDLRMPNLHSPTTSSNSNPGAGDVEMTDADLIRRAISYPLYSPVRSFHPLPEETHFQLAATTET